MVGLKTSTLKSPTRMRFNKYDGFKAERLSWRMSKLRKYDGNSISDKIENGNIRTEDLV